MKILFVASVYRHLTVFHIPYMQYFQSQGYEVWAAAGIGNEDKENLQKLNIKCVDIPFSRSPLSAQNMTAYQALKKLFHSERFDLVHVHTPIAALLSRAAFRNVKHGKIVYTAHGFHFYKGAPKQNWLIYYTAEKLAAKWTDHLITMNDEDYKNAQKLLPVEKISYVHGVGVEFTTEVLTSSEKAEMKAQLCLPNDAVVISCVAEMNSNKNHQFLLRNWQQLKQDNPNLELLLIGNGEMEHELQTYVAKEQLVGIHFLGYRRDVPKLLQISDIVTLLSHREGLPKSIMEAMEASIPCVVTNTRGLRDLVQTNENGYVIEHGDDQSLIAAFAKLAQSAHLREQMGQRAKQLVEPFVLDMVLQEYITIYKKLLK
ncbi:glycosyltransferase family 4 protein [Solibacillus sp. MA9]|uniref:Glycosyltransferase family 4 protein n=1 Tax=Solibacillus palustris TaxID=2908203 RepID=A0ABS9U8G0_9BACL|nr:glycosyltransferase family 4 protein [Solibacillus sp. MA9]MCH7320611.1 glycosyltransferase family 4 protein [Solibacillus sp. MA9]